jgi:hypothetical protein
MKHAHSFASDGSHGVEDELGGGDGDRAAPFGDTFRSRGDYSSGTFYAYRRKFLADSDNVLKPPDEFMTKKQMRNSIKINRGGVQTLKTMVSYPTENLLVTKAQKAKQEAAVIRRNRKKNEGMIVLDTYSSVNEKDWSEEMRLQLITRMSPPYCPYVCVGHLPSIKVGKMTVLCIRLQGLPRSASPLARHKALNTQSAPWDRIMVYFGYTPSD